MYPTNKHTCPAAIDDIYSYVSKEHDLFCKPGSEGIFQRVKKLDDQITHTHNTQTTLEQHESRA